MESIGCIGAGRMITALVEGWLAHSPHSRPQITCLDGGGGSAMRLAEQTGIRQADSLADLLSSSSMIVVGCKPSQLSSLPGAALKAAQPKIVLSVLAGVRLTTLRNHFSGAGTIFRAMPNVASRIGAGVTLLSAEESADPKADETVREFLGAAGLVVPIPETQMDAGTAIAGSGPAYILEFVDALGEAGVKAGLPQDLSFLLAREMALGTLRLLARTKEDPVQLRDSVVSKGGTTEVALQVFSAAGLRHTIDQAVTKAVARSRELGR